MNIDPNNIPVAVLGTISVIIVIWYGLKQGREDNNNRKNEQLVELRKPMFYSIPEIEGFGFLFRWDGETVKHVDSSLSGESFENILISSDLIPGLYEIKMHRIDNNKSEVE